MQSDNGLMRDHIEDAIAGVDTTADTTLVPVSFRMTDGSARIFLNQGFVTVDEDCKWYWKRKHNAVRDEIPDWPPVFIEFTHSRNDLSSNFIERYYESPEEECDAVYELGISTTSDIWIDDETGDEDVDTIAQINRARFYDAFSKIEDSEDLLATYWISVDFAPIPEHADALLNYDGPPAKELLAEYRSDWTETRLRGQAIGETIDGKRIVHFGPVDEYVFPEELKLRVEVYLRENKQYDTVDQVRVTTNGGETLTGIVRDGDVRWNS